MHRRSWKIFCHSIASLAILILFAHTGQAAQDSSTVLTSQQLPAATPVYNIANVVYVTYRIANNSNDPFKLQCPAGMAYVTGSGTNVPAIPQVFPQNMLYWQCMENVSAWNTKPSTIVGDAQPFQNITFMPNTYPGTNQVITSPPYLNGVYQSVLTSPAFQTGSPFWALDSVNDPNGSAQFTYFAFPGNGFIPTGVGGSGLQCGVGSGDLSTISCTDSFGRPIPSNYPNNSFQPITGVSPPAVFYISPNTSATCVVTRVYHNNPSAQCGPTTVNVPSGQTKVMACCSGKWACATSNWNDAQLTQCLNCPPQPTCN